VTMHLLVPICLVAAGVASEGRVQQSKEAAQESYFSPLPRARIGTQTPVTAWSRAGWNAFRWGMGPRDVADRLRDNAGGFRVRDPDVWTDCEVSTRHAFSSYCEVQDTAEHAFTILGLKPTLIQFNFIDDRLSEIGIWLGTSRPGSLNRDEGEHLFTQLLDSLTSQNGTPSYQSRYPPRQTGNSSARDVELWTIQWETAHVYPGERKPRSTRGFDVKLEVVLKRAANWGEVQLAYSEEHGDDHFNGRARGDPPASETEKLRGVSGSDRPGGKPKH
jgi:hypothetical protein